MRDHALGIFETSMARDRTAEDVMQVRANAIGAASIEGVAGAALRNHSLAAGFQLGQPGCVSEEAAEIRRADRFGRAAARVERHFRQIAGRRGIVWVNEGLGQDACAHDTQHRTQHRANNRIVPEIAHGPP